MVSVLISAVTISKASKQIAGLGTQYQNAIVLLRLELHIKVAVVFLQLLIKYLDNVM